MPLPNHLRKGIDSPTADIANMGERMGGGLVAGIFLKEFVADGITWAHLRHGGAGVEQTAGRSGTRKDGGEDHQCVRWCGWPSHCLG
ncbi:putative cytosol aminopeptidase OS=Streptomyces antimycoticus OX=68175 GN=pepA PE=3 SV=1 [Streptomyces antimycoticus]